MFVHHSPTLQTDYLTCLANPGADFSATYTAVAGLQFAVPQLPPDRLRSVVRALSLVLEKERHTRRRQAYFLHKKAADALQEIILKRGKQADITQAAHRALTDCLSKSGSTALRAAAEALGALPVRLPPPLPLPAATAPAPELTWPALLDQVAEKPGQAYAWRGRTLVLSLAESGRLLTIKTTDRPDDQDFLQTEGVWMDYLGRLWPRICDRPDIFRIPRPLQINDGYVFKISRLPGGPNRPAGRRTGYFATGYISDPDYFRYPNEHDPDRPLSNREMIAVFSNNAFILGRLAATGIIHTAPIPLFHNRVQRHRRDDGGLYQWPRGGRLDRWLDSCRYPNIGPTGPRDFEHFIGFDDSPRKLYEHLGTHLLSLVLVAGSCFRNKAPERVGLMTDGTPVDARDLFDPILLQTAITRIFYAYYQGFTGARFSGQPPFDWGRLTERLIEEMGVDRHMEEILRVAEQAAMSDGEFRAFLVERGFSQERIDRLKRAAADITILTGPHLGAFNSSISLPELTEFAAVSAAVCLAGRFFNRTDDCGGRETLLE